MSKLIFALVLICSIVKAEDAKFFIKGKEGTKADALRALVVDPKTEVVKCVRIEITSDAKLRNK